MVGIIHTVGSVNEPYIVRFLDDSDPVKILLGIIYIRQTRPANFLLCAYSTESQAGLFLS